MYKKCTVCGEIYVKKQTVSLKAWNNSKYCSRYCKYISQIGKKQTKEVKNKRRKHPHYFHCKICGKKILNKRGSPLIKYCSQKCHGKSKTGINPFKDYTPWNKGKKGVQKCSKETRLKISESHKGEKSYLWKGGITKLSFKIRNSLDYKDWRSKIFKRDNFTCQECGDKTGSNLQAHHIKNFSLIIIDNNIIDFDNALLCDELWDTNNGITLCKKCHRKKHPNLKFI